MRPPLALLVLPLSFLETSERRFSADRRCLMPTARRIWAVVPCRCVASRDIYDGKGC